MPSQAEIIAEEIVASSTNLSQVELGSIAVQIIKDQLQNNGYVEGKANNLVADLKAKVVIILEAKKKFSVDEICAIKDELRDWHH